MVLTLNTLHIVHNLACHLPSIALAVNVPLINRARNESQIVTIRHCETADFRQIEIMPYLNIASACVETAVSDYNG
jgi:hypothetical protein